MCVVACGAPYLRLKGPLQRAEGSSGGDDWGNAGHGRGVGVEQLRKERESRGVRTGVAVH